MDELLNFLQKYEIWIYVLISAVSFLYIRRMIQSAIEWRRAIFGLEREIARRKFLSALSIFLLLSLLGIIEFSLVTFVVPVYPQLIARITTPTLNPAATPTNTVVVSEASSRESQPTPTSVALIAEGCVPNQIEWTNPKNNSELRGKIELSGSINVTNLGFYKYEYAAVGNENWITIAADNANNRVDAVLGVWDTSQLIPGDYRLRLVVADNQNQFLPACVINIRITAP